VSFADAEHAAKRKKLQRVPSLDEMERVALGKPPLDLIKPL
jgi:hypothetical protein